MSDSAYQTTYTGTAGGDLSGTYPNPTVAKIRGRDVSNSVPVVGQVLTWNGSAWVPQTPEKVVESAVFLFTNDSVNGPRNSEFVYGFYDPFVSASGLVTFF